MEMLRRIKQFLRSRNTGNRSLPELVTLMADHPTISNRNAFYLALRTSRLGAYVEELPPVVTAGEHRVQAGENFTVPTTTGPDGAPMLLVFCDIPGMAAANPNKSWFDLEGETLLNMALQNEAGIIVQNGLDGRQSWAGVPNSHVAGILAGEYD